MKNQARVQAALLEETYGPGPTPPISLITSFMMDPRKKVEFSLLSERERENQASSKDTRRIYNMFSLVYIIVCPNHGKFLIILNQAFRTGV